MNMASISAAISGLKNVKELVQDLLKLKSSVDRKSVV